VDGERVTLGSEAVLSRWHVQGCANCQTHLRAGANFRLHGLEPEALEQEDVLEVEVRTHDGLLGDRVQTLGAVSGQEGRPLRIEIR
jgi:tyrosinase